jgi:ATP-dependent DNA ligase
MSAAGPDAGHGPRLRLPVLPPVRPMLARSVSVLPQGMLYEPKWDGFRCVAFRDGAAVELGSRNDRPLTRYFPEVAAAVRAELPSRCVVDGEIVVPDGPVLDFEALLQRIHPANSRVELLARETPATLIVFDLLALGDDSYLGRPFAERRAALEAALTGAHAGVRLTPITSSHREASRWFHQFEGAGLDGVVAKPPEVAYERDKRVMFKVKHERTADCVVAGFRWHKSGPVVGSLLLGLHDERGRLQHVGVSASFPMRRRRELLDELAPYRLAAGDEHPWLGGATPERIPGGEPSRWQHGKDLSWEPLAPTLVVEVAYDHMEGRRFRHTAHFRRWRPDRTPESCGYEQLERPVKFDLARILAGDAGGVASSSGA